GMLRWRVESNIRHGYKARKNLERLDRTIQVLVINGVFIVVHTGIWPCHLGTNEENTIITRIGLDLRHCCSSPRYNSRLLPHRVAYEIKRERLVDSNYVDLAIGSVVIHVALIRMTLAPRAFIGHYVFRFGEVLRPGIHRCVQV